MGQVLSLKYNLVIYLNIYGQDDACTPTESKLISVEMPGVSYVLSTITVCISVNSLTLSLSPHQYLLQFKD